MTPRPFWNFSENSSVLVPSPVPLSLCVLTFLNMYTGKRASFLPWKQNQPNGGRDENYVTVGLKHLQEENKVRKEILTNVLMRQYQYFEKENNIYQHLRWNSWTLQRTARVAALAKFETRCFSAWKDFVNRRSWVFLNVVFFYKQ